MEIIIKNNMHSIIDKNVALDESIKISKKESTRIMNIKPLKMLFLKECVSPLYFLSSCITFFNFMM